MGAKPGRELNSRSEKIGMMLNRLSRGGSDPNFDLATVAALLLVLGKLTLDTSCTFHRRCRRHERCHDTVSGVLDLTTANASRTIVSCTPSKTIAASSPKD